MNVNGWKRFYRLPRVKFEKTILKGCLKQATFFYALMPPSRKICDRIIRNKKTVLTTCEDRLSIK